jgi:hypothetical protein
MQTLNLSLRVFKPKISEKKYDLIQTTEINFWGPLTVFSGSQTVLAKFSNCSCTHTVKLRALNFF